MNLFIPKMYVKDIFSINYNKLKNNGYKIIIFDLDNTIGNIKENIFDKKTSDFLNKLNKEFKIIIASNSSKKRVLTFCQNIECGKYYFSLKPLSLVLYKIKKKNNINYDKMVIVGDQLLTDIVLGNRKGLCTILVDKKNKKDLIITKFNRIIENIIKKKYNIKKGAYYSWKNV